MSYTKARVIRTDNAISAIQSVGNPDPSKPIGVYLEFVSPPNYSTINAYEADE